MGRQCSFHSCEHLVQFYSDSSELMNPLAEFLNPWLAQGQVGVIIATPEHAAELEALLARPQAGELVVVDARSLLEQFMRDGMPDEELFAEHVGGLLQRHSGKKVRAFGEMVDLLWEEGNGEAALRVEELWNQLGTMLSFTLFCAYSMDRFSEPENQQSFLEICNAHSQMIPSSVCERVELLAHLQQKALAMVMTGSRYQWGQGTMEMAITRLGHFEIDLESRRVVGSRQFKTHLGLDPKTAVPFPHLSHRIHPDDRNMVENELSFAVAREIDLALEFRVMDEKGTADYYTVLGCCLSNGHHRMVGVSAKL